jgi:glycosyltransferase involved in cell wall biosynthesis
MLNGISNTEVLHYMQKAHIFIFTSDRIEGWGAVLNEAMDCGCVVVASHLIGATPFLIKHQQNGSIFESGNLTHLLQQTERSIIDKMLRDKLGKNAYNTIKNDWSPEKATANFIRLAKSILDGQKITIASGPCSIVENTSKKYWEKEML